MDSNTKTILMIVGAAAIFGIGYYLGRSSKTYGDFLDEMAMEVEPLED